VSSLPLHYRSYGDPGSRPLLLLHGLLGSSANWHSIARALERDFRVIVPDLRNHGRSPHSPDMDFPLMAADLAALIQRLELGAAELVGHSLGGKVAMQLALESPEMVRGLVVVDIAPVRYDQRFQAMIAALQGLDLANLDNRRQADRQLAGLLDDPGLRQYLLQNLVKEEGRWRWRMHLDGLIRAMPKLMDFPAVSRRQFPGPALFIYGGASEYVRPEHAGPIRERFPLARLRMVPGAGHWVYAEQPEAFLHTVTAFLGRD
jgi:pimeloyl-ACP methyl ester carboxylesterase